MNFLNNITPEKKRLLIIVGIILLVLILILSIVFAMLSSKQDPTEEYEITDPASQETVLTSDIPGQYSDSPLYFGLNILYKYHTDNWIEGTMSIISLYARSENIELSRISIVEGSYLVVDTPNLSADTFSVVLNIDQVNLDVSVSYTADGADVIISSQNIELFRKEMVYDARYIKIDGILPSWLNEGPIIRTQYNESLKLLAESNLPPIKNSESVRLYFACPLSGQTTTDNCYIYKYDLYY